MNYLFENVNFSGFGMLESGCVSVKNEVNIMMKNIADIVLGGIIYHVLLLNIKYNRF